MDHNIEYIAHQTLYCFPVFTFTIERKIAPRSTESAHARVCGLSIIVSYLTIATNVINWCEVNTSHLLHERLMSIHQKPRSSRARWVENEAES